MKNVKKSYKRHVDTVFYSAWLLLMVLWGFFAVLGLKLKAYTLSHSASHILQRVFFEIGSHGTICLGWRGYSFFHSCEFEFLSNVFSSWMRLSYSCRADDRFLVFCMSTNVLTSSFLKNLAGSRILGWYTFSFSTWRMSSLCVLMKARTYLTEGPLYLSFCFPASVLLFQQLVYGLSSFEYLRVNCTSSSLKDFCLLACLFFFLPQY
jgi:hypothetical protein